MNTSGSGCSGGDGKPLVATSSSSSGADTGAAADRDDREERAAGDRPLEVLDQHLLVDLLAAEVALHQRLVLGLLDDALDQRAAQLLDLGRAYAASGAGVDRLPSAYS